MGAGMRWFHLLGLFALVAGCASGAAVPPSRQTTSPCPESGGSMVRLPLGWCIDATEVTRAAYASWVGTGPSVSEQIAACSWNTSFVPAKGFEAPETEPELPVTWVDWCDAYAYCRAMGKRLCGERTMLEDADGRRESELYAACSANGTYEYTYGNTLDVASCNTADAGKGRVVAVGTMRRCQSPAPGYGGVYDLSGNVWEWAGRCYDRGQQGGPDTFCALEGGSFSLIGTYSRCGYPHSASRSNPSDDVGFRCCAP